MPMSSLPVDCVTIILENLRYEPGCLFSCLLINRSWCRVTVPILWSDPFSTFGEKFGRNIIRSYLICLDYENRLNLIKNGINISLSENPLFGYHKYLQFLEYELLNHLVRSWMIENEHFKYFDITLYEESSVSKHQFCLIMSILCKLFMENCSIKSFRLSKSWRHLDIPDISMFSSGNLGLTKTRELEICFTEDESIMPNTAKLLKLLSSLCTELRSLSIILPMTTDLRDMSEFYDLFKAQRNLERFKLCWSRQIFDNFLRVMNSQVNTQINTTLTSLQLHRIKLDNLSLDALEFCSCLKTFKIINLCEDLTLTPQCLSSSSVYFFKSFYFWSNCNMSAQSTAAIIKKSGRSLQKLHLDLITSDTVDAILNYCPNISEILKVIRDYVKSKNVLKTLNFTSHPLRYICEKELNDILVMKQELHENVNVLLDYSKDYYNLEMAA